MPNGIDDASDRFNVSAVSCEQDHKALSRVVTVFKAFNHKPDSVVDARENPSNNAQRIRVKARFDCGQSQVQLVDHEVISRRGNTIYPSVSLPSPRSIWVIF